MDWNTREKVLGYFVDFVVGEIDEIENIISWANARNRPETAMNKIRQIVVARQEVAIYAHDVLMEQTKLPDRWALVAAGAGTLQWRKRKDKDRSKVGTSGLGELMMLDSVFGRRFTSTHLYSRWVADSAGPEAPVCSNRALGDAQSTACDRRITHLLPTL